MPKNSQKGIITVIILIVVALIILGYFGFDLRRIVESPQVQENLTYAWNLIKVPFLWLWNFLMGLWEGFETYLTNLIGGGSNILDPNR
jgi:hypothetical protein